jgi:hypothetical protein
MRELAEATLYQGSQFIAPSGRSPRFIGHFCAGPRTRREENPVLSQYLPGLNRNRLKGLLFCFFFRSGLWRRSPLSPITRVRLSGIAI